MFGECGDICRDTVGYFNVARVCEIFASGGPLEHHSVAWMPRGQLVGGVWVVLKEEIVYGVPAILRATDEAVVDPWLRSLRVCECTRLPLLLLHDLRVFGLREG